LNFDSRDEAVLDENATGPQNHHANPFIKKIKVQIGLKKIEQK